MVEISGGEFYTAHGIELGSPTGIGTGTFSIQGSGATAITVGDTADGRWQQYSNSTFKVGIDAGGVTPVNIQYGTGANGAGGVRFEAGSILDIDFVGSHSETGTWTVMTWEGDFINLGLELSADAITAGWDAGVLEGTNLVVSFGEDAPELPGIETPLIPNNLLGRPTGLYEVTLNWEVAIGADRYTLKRSETSDGPYIDMASDIVDLTYIDTTPSTDQTYYYVVVGVNDQGEGVLSDEKKVVVIPYLIIGADSSYGADSGLNKENLFDDDIDTFFDTQTYNTYVGLDYGENNEQQVFQINYVLRNWGWRALEYATNCTFEGSNDPDFLTSEILYTVPTNVVAYPATNTAVITSTTAFRYVRLMARSDRPLYAFSELDFLTSEDYTANNTPKYWLDTFYDVEADFGGDYDAAELSDTDQDGHLAWEEYVAGTDPTDETSVLQVTAISNTVNGIVFTWQSVADKSYSIITNSSLLFPNKGTVASGITGLETETSYTSTVSGASSVFFEIGVE